MREPVAEMFVAARDATIIGKIFVSSIDTLKEYARSDETYPLIELSGNSAKEFKFDQLSLSEEMLVSDRIETFTDWDNKLRKVCKYKNIMKPILQRTLNMVVKRRDEAMSERGFLKLIVDKATGDQGTRSACYLFYNFILYQILEAAASDNPNKAKDRLTLLKEILRKTVTNSRAKPGDASTIFSENIRAIIDRLTLLTKRYEQLALKLTLKDYLGIAQDSLRDIFVYSFSELRALLAGVHIDDADEYTALSAAEERISSERLREVSPSLRLLHLFFMSAPMSAIITGESDTEADNTTLNHLCRLLETNRFHAAMLNDDIDYKGTPSDESDSEESKSEEVDSNSDSNFLDESQLAEMMKMLPELAKSDSLLLASREFGSGNSSIFRYLNHDGECGSRAFQLAGDFLQVLASLSRLTRLYKSMQLLGDATGILGDTYVRFLPEGVLSLRVLGELVESEIKAYKSKIRGIHKAHDWITSFVKEENEAQYQCIILNQHSAEHFKDCSKATRKELLSAFRSIDARLKYLSEARVYRAVEQVRVCADELLTMARIITLDSPAVGQLDEFLNPKRKHATVEESDGADDAEVKSHSCTEDELDVSIISTISDVSDRVTGPRLMQGARRKSSQDTSETEEHESESRSTAEPK